MAAQQVLPPPALCLLVPSTAFGDKVQGLWCFLCVCKEPDGFFLNFYFFMLQFNRLPISLPTDEVLKGNFQRGAALGG